VKLSCFEKKLFDKISSSTTLCIDKRIKIRKRAKINYFFQLHYNSCLYKRRRKTAIKLFL